MCRGEENGFLSNVIDNFKKVDSFCACHRAKCVKKGSKKSAMCARDKFELFIFAAIIHGLRRVFF